MASRNYVQRPVTAHAEGCNSSHSIWADCYSYDRHLIGALIGSLTRNRARSEVGGSWQLLAQDVGVREVLF